MKSPIEVKVIVNDLEAIKSIKPEQAIAYLQSKGWQKEHTIQRNIASVWGYQKPEGEQFQILIPHNMEIAGYPFSMNFMLETLADIYDVSQLDILQSILELPAKQAEGSERSRVSSSQIPPNIIDPDLIDENFIKAKPIKAVEVTGTVDEKGQFLLDRPLENFTPSRVRAIILFPEVIPFL